MANLCMYIGPVLLILSVICGLGYNHYTNKVKKLKEQQSEVEPTSKGAKADFSIKQVSIVRIKSENAPYDGNLGLLVYFLTLVNSSKEAITIKEVVLEYDWDGKHYSEDALNLFTGIVWDKQKKKNDPALCLKINSKDDLYILKWYNLREQIAKGILLQPGAILQGSAFYLFKFSNPIDFSRVKNLSLMVVDYLGNKTSNPVIFEDGTEMGIMDLVNKKFEKVAKE